MSDEDRIASLARAFCAADGQDPDEVVPVGIEVIVERDGSERHCEVIAPACTVYLGKARRMAAIVPSTRLLE